MSLCAINGVVMSPKQAVDILTRHTHVYDRQSSHKLTGVITHWCACGRIEPDLSQCPPGGTKIQTPTAHPPIDTTPPVKPDPSTVGFGTHLGFTINTLGSYTTPYFYAEGPRPLGSVNHFDTIRKLKNYMNRMVKAGKLAPKGG